MHYIIAAALVVLGFILGVLSVIARLLGMETSGKRNIRAQEARRTLAYYRGRRQQKVAYAGRHSAQTYRLAQSPATGLFEYELAA